MLMVLLVFVRFVSWWFAGVFCLLLIGCGFGVVLVIGLCLVVVWGCFVGLFAGLLVARYFRLLIVWFAGCVSCLFGFESVALFCAVCWVP